MVSINLATSANLLRYISEWDPREPAHTKGGYMDGSITIPNIPGKLKMVIQTHPASDIDPNLANIHPCILHVVRIGKGKREQGLEPVPTYYHWKQEFEIEDGKVRILNKTSELDVEKDGVTPRQVPLIDDITTIRGNSITLSRKRGDLNLILLQPKQKARAKANEATVTKVLADRLRTELGTDCAQTIEMYEKIFKNANSLKRICLKVEFFTEDGQQCGSDVSAPIVDTGNKAIGSMDFYDATPHKSCVLGGRKVIMVSEYTLDKSVSPIFQVFDQNDQHQPEFDQFLVQPHKDEINLKNQTIIFITPNQPMLAKIGEYLENYKIKLLAKRLGDGYTSPKMFNFRYIDHQVDNCPFCDHKVDSDEHVQIEAGIDRPKPRQKKRVMHNTRVYNNEKRKRVYSTDDDSIASSALSPGFKLSPASYGSPSNTWSPPDSGVDSYFSNSDGGYTPESEFDTPTNGARNISTVYAPFLGKVEDILMDEDQIPIPSTLEGAVQMLGLPAENTESLWGHQKIEETSNYTTISDQIDQSLNEDTTPTFNENDLFSLLETVNNNDNPPQTNQTSTIEQSPVEFVTDFSSLDMMMTQRDPMLSHGSMTITSELRTPVVFERRICRDSANNMKEIKKPIDGEITTEETKSKMAKERKEKKLVHKKEKISKSEPEHGIFDNFPIFVMIFMAILVILNLINQATLQLPPFAVTGLAMASAILVTFVKRRI